MAHNIRRIPRLTFDFDMAMPHLEIIQHLRQHEVGQRGGRADADFARQLVTRHQREHILELIVQRGQPFFEQPPLVVEPDAPAHPVEQRNPQLRLKIPERTGNRRLRYEQLGRSVPHIRRPRQGQKNFQIPKRHKPLLSAAGCLRQTAMPSFLGNGSGMGRQPY